MGLGKEGGVGTEPPLLTTDEPYEELPKGNRLADHKPRTLYYCFDGTGSPSSA